MISKLGSLATTHLSWLKKVGLFSLSIIYWLVVGPFKAKFGWHKSIVNQMLFVGVLSIAIVFFVDIFTGIVLAMQAAYQLEKMGTVVYVASLVAISLCRELSPVLTGLVVAGRVGSAIAAELGTMKVTEQIEALETMAINPVGYLAVPRVVALFVMMPILTVLGNFSGIFGGFLVGTLSLNIDPDLYMRITYKFLELKDIYTGIIKAVVFGLIIAIVGCYEGLYTADGASGVGRATTRSVVASFILIILANCILTAIFYFSKI